MAETKDIVAAMGYHKLCPPPEVSRIYQAINALSAANQAPRPEVGYEAERYKEKSGTK